MPSNRLAGHELPDEGKVFERGIYRVQVGAARCTCGKWSPELPSDNARKKWHRTVHKPEVRALKKGAGR